MYMYPNNFYKFQNTGLAKTEDVWMIFSLGQTFADFFISNFEKKLLKQGEKAFYLIIHLSKVDDITATSKLQSHVCPLIDRLKIKCALKLFYQWVKERTSNHGSRYNLQMPDYTQISAPIIKTTRKFLQ